jgi:diguanylate cyclase (GGDEF)-like protein
VALAVTSAETRAQLALMASTDHLTGLPNHRAFEERRRREVEHAQEAGRPLSLVVLDLDRFKRINDRHGHEAGNRVLAEAARRLGSSVRAEDMLAHVGSEEFAWILPGADAAAAMAVAERARRAVGGRPFAEVGRNTISAGVADLDGARDADQLFRRADAALYAAKDGGRDAVHIFAPLTFPAPTGTA